MKTRFPFNCLPRFVIFDRMSQLISTFWPSWKWLKKWVIFYHFLKLFWSTFWYSPEGRNVVSPTRNAHRFWKRAFRLGESSIWAPWCSQVPLGDPLKATKCCFEEALELFWALFENRRLAYTRARFWPREHLWSAPWRTWRVLTWPFCFVFTVFSRGLQKSISFVKKL